MKSALDQFRENQQRARELVELTSAIDALTTEAIDLGDLLRSALVLSVSALDHFVHEHVRAGMVEAHRGLKKMTDAHLRFPVSVVAVHEALGDPARHDWLANAVRDAHSWLAFQQPEKIADAIRLISDVALWEEVGRRMGRTAADVKTELKTIVGRRNKIAHEADMNPTFPGVRWPIDERLTIRALDFVADVAEAIAAVT